MKVFPEASTFPAATAAGRDNTADRSLLARTLAYLFGAGATLALVSMALPDSPDSGTWEIAVSQVGYAVAAIAVLVVLLVGFDRLPMWTFQFILAAGTGLISLAILFSEDPTSAYTMFYLWVVLYAFYFFAPSQATLQLVVVALCYGAVLSTKTSVTAPLTRWLVTVGTLAVAGTLIALLRRRVDDLVGRLKDTARTDPLTGLLNRRGFEEIFRIELERARLTGEPLAVAVLDLDHFKNVNDQFGHDVGDGALERVSRVIRATKRHADSAARIGGEEFAVILSGCGDRDAHGLAERLRSQIREAFTPEPFELTISLGIASFPNDGVSRDDLLRAADRALYEAKRLGRDRSVVHSTAALSGGEHALAS